MGLCVLFQRKAVKIMKLRKCSGADIKRVDEGRTGALRLLVKWELPLNPVMGRHRVLDSINNKGQIALCELETRRARGLFLE